MHVAHKYAWASRLTGRPRHQLLLKRPRLPRRSTPSHYAPLPLRPDAQEAALYAGARWDLEEDLGVDEEWQAAEGVGVLR